MRSAVGAVWGALLALGLTSAQAQTIEIIPLEDLTDEPGLTLQDLEDDGITLETFTEDELDMGPRQVLTDEDFQTFEQELQVSAAPAGALRVLDKLTGAVTDLELETDGAETVGRIMVTLHECRFPTENPTSDAFVRLTITDTNAAELFTGWMVASSPALMALDHPRYDVWALRCTAGAEAVAEGEVIDTATEALLDAEEADRESGAITVSPFPRPRPDR